MTTRFLAASATDTDLSTGPDQGDVDALRGLLDLMADFSDNDQRARYLLTCNWMVERGATASALARRGLVEVVRRAHPVTNRKEAMAEIAWVAREATNLIEERVAETSARWEAYQARKAQVLAYVEAARS